MKKKNTFKTFVMVLLTAMGWIFGAAVCYEILVNGMYFTFDISDIDATVDTIGQICICGIPVLTAIYTLASIHDMVREMDEKERLRKKHEMFYNAYHATVK